MQEKVRLIKEKVHEYEKDMVSFLRDIISIPSHSGREKKVVQRIQKEMKKVGLDEIRVDGLGNIIGRLGSGSKILAYDAHIDTVEVGDPSLWDSMDPFKGKLQDGIIYGRGASDQKAPVASFVYAAKIIKELGLSGDYTLYLVGSVMEEDCDGLCWQYLINEEKLRPDLVVITEPTNLNIYRGHRGRMEIRVVVKGLSCHGSAPERGDNAIYKMADIVKEIEALNGRLRQNDFLGKGTVTVTQIFFSSPSQCAVPDECTIQLDRRLTTGETKDTAVAEIQALQSVKKHGGRVEILKYQNPAYTGLVYPTEKYYPTWTLPDDHPYLAKARTAFELIFQKQPLVDKWTFSTNGVAIMGMHGIPCIGFGPANEIYAHSPKDQVPVEHVLSACEFYCVFPQIFAGIDEN
ncbi:MAG: YgeY family selenium metabolism-linked hydrolase [Candidatus Wallbacteria bacterium]|nr:YgeY family selenium metabolism-linked hydrolase [Candidatus Wallbacteria bacterium]